MDGLINAIVNCCSLYFWWIYFSQSIFVSFDFLPFLSFVIHVLVILPEATSLVFAHHATYPQPSLVVYLFSRYLHVETPSSINPPHILSYICSVSIPPRISKCM